MKGIILAGGTGSRLHPLTRVTNKHLLPVYNRPMIFYPVDTLIRSGITDIMIVTGKEYGGSFMNLLGSGLEFGARFHYALQDNAGGIAEALSLVEEFVHAEPMVVILGDNIIFDDIRSDISSFRSGARIFLKEIKDPQRFGVPFFDGNRIAGIEEKPQVPKSPYAVTGLYMYDKTVFDKIRSIERSARGELEITDVNNLYISKNELSYGILKEAWLDAGTFDSLLEASITIRDMLSGIKEKGSS
ncbi:MAG: sugar phosphate nucleotidyltransferase [Thermoplasmataceae archaeon]